MTWLKHTRILITNDSSLFQFQCAAKQNGYPKRAASTQRVRTAVLRWSNQAVCDGKRMQHAREATSIRSSGWKTQRKRKPPVKHMCTWAHIIKLITEKQNGTVWLYIEGRLHSSEYRLSPRCTQTEATVFLRALTFVGGGGCNSSTPA
jgi:hypothetical protein